MKSIQKNLILFLCLFCVGTTQVFAVNDSSLLKEGNLSFSFYTSCIDFSKNFRSDIKNKLGVNPNEYALNYGLNFRLHRFTPRVALDVSVEGGNIFGNTNHKKLRINNLDASLVLVGAIYGSKRFLLSAYGSLGVSETWMKYEYNTNGSNEVSIDQLLQNPLQYQELSLRQKVVGLLGVGLQADIRFADYLSLGLFVRWKQQIGQSYFYTSSKTKVGDVSKLMLNPLCVGVVLGISSNR